MGCDIHFCVEKKTPRGWVSKDHWETEKDDGETTRHLHTSFYSARNYDLFAILADVKNGRGFAGFRTGDGFTPIAKPKGLPADVSAEVKEYSDQWGSDGHSHSWHTVADLLDYNWRMTTTKSGMLDGREFYEWRRWRRGQGLGPESYSAAVFGKDIKEMPLETMLALCSRVDELLEDPILRANEQATIDAHMKNVVCRVEWEVYYNQVAQDFLSETLPKLWRLGSPEDIRIVFWFDN